MANDFPQYSARLFIDTCLGVHEKRVILQELSETRGRLEFDLCEYDAIENLRFNPLNTMVVLRLEHIKIITARHTLDNNIPYTTNALGQQENLLIFEMNEPMIYINMKDISTPKMLVIHLEYIAWGDEVYRYIGKNTSSLITGKDEKISQQRQTIQEQEQILQQQKRQNYCQTQIIRQQKQKIQAIYNTLSWKITAPLRTIWNVCHFTEFLFTLRKILHLLHSNVKSEHRISLFLEEAVNPDGESSEMKTTPIIQDEAKEQSLKFAKMKLNAFLETEGIMLFPEFHDPLLTIILILFNRSELTFQCLEGIKAHLDVPYEIVIVDNASDDDTSPLLKRLHNVKILKNAENVGFLKACNQAVESARGKYVLFLNNDTQILPQTFSSLVNTIESDPKIGVVGGKLIFPNGKLQEAGNIIWRDGSCLGYGRGDEPSKPEYSYIKEVGYCSGALLLTPRNLFIKLGKFDERYAPAYCEDVDYCLNVRANGYKVIYQPLAQIIHCEFASSRKSNEAIQLQRANTEILREKWATTLADYYEPKKKNILFAREWVKQKQIKRILFIDDRIPDPTLGCGFPRSFDMLNTFVDLGYRVTFFPLQIPEYSASVAQYFQQRGVEVMYDHSGRKDKLDLHAFLKRRRHYYDILLISRPHNMQEFLPFKNILDDHTKVVYDCEAIFAMREYLYMEIRGQPTNETIKKNLVTREIELAKHANSVITVSAKEKELFEKYSASNIYVVGFKMNVSPTPNTFDERHDILFVGAILSSPNPNEDAVLNFAKNIYPSIYEKTGAKLLIVGTNKTETVWQLQSSNIVVTGKVESVSEYYNHCKIFVIPTRYAAGIPYKLYEASSYGIPAVVTPLIAEQVGWEEGKNLLIGYGENDFAQKCVELYTLKNLWETIRDGALHRIENDCHSQKFKENLRNVCESST